MIRFHGIFAISIFQIDPLTRPTAQEIIEDLQPQLHILEEASKTKITLRKVGHKRSLSEEEIVIRKSSPSEKARFHFKSTVMTIGTYEKKNVAVFY